MIDIQQNLQIIRDRINLVANRAGRKPEEIKLIAVSKKKPTSAIREAARASQLIFSENYLQDAKGKIEELNDLNLTWHFIGHLQSNKAKIAASLFDMVETVDRLKIAKAINRHAGDLGKTIDILVQVNTSREEQKSGVLPENCEELLAAIKPLPNLRLKGLMTIPPFTPDPEDSRPYFQQLAQLAHQMAAYFHEQNNNELSMGMTRDFTIAIEEGATMVRVGTAIFGTRE